MIVLGQIFATWAISEEGSVRVCLHADRFQNPRRLRLRVRGLLHARVGRAGEARAPGLLRVAGALGAGLRQGWPGEIPTKS